jgi:pyruvate dehydrogenase E1 component alpha subunit
MAQQRIPKILIISSDTGGGHRSAAAAIVAGVQKFFEGESYAVRVVRAVEESHHLSAKLVRLSYSATTRTTAVTAGPGPAARAESLGLPAESIDGNDALAVDAAARAAVAAVRAGEGPRFLHCRTYRMTGHTGVDPAAYRAATEVEEWRAADPIDRLAQVLRLAGGDVDGLGAEAEAEMAAVLDTARASARPEAALAFADVQDVGDPRERAF